MFAFPLLITVYIIITFSLMFPLLDIFLVRIFSEIGRKSEVK